MEGDRLSRNFKYSEFEYSNTAKRLGIDNTIPADVRDNIKALVDNILQPLRDSWGGPLFINSGYRCKELNDAVGGVETSQHRLGQAADVACTDPAALARLIKWLRLDFDQVGLYPNFLHISYRNDGENRNQIFYSSKWSGPKI